MPASLSRVRGGPFATTALLLLVVMLAMSPHFGVTWDEPQQHAKAHALVDYLTGAVPSLSVPLDGAHLYGAPLGVVAVLLEPVIPVDPYVLRHAINATVGWAGLVLCALLADRLFGPPHGLLAFFLLAACPRYIADSMNNSKDLPFAAAATGVLLALSYVHARPPFVTWRLVALLVGVIGFALNVRAGALVFLAYLGVVLMLRLLQARAGPIDWVRSITRAAVVAGGALAVGWVAWPWAYRQPLVAPFRAMSELGHFGWSLGVLFAGREYAGTTVPPSYLPTWLWLGLPPAITVGSALSLRSLRNRTVQGATIGLVGAILFPLVYVIGTRATLYDASRHLLFVVPPLAVLAAAGWIGVIRQFGAPPWRWITVAALTVGLMEPVWFQVRNFPNQTAYIQPLAGGPAAAYGRYDLDYWGNCMLEAVDAVDRQAARGPVYISGWPLIVLQADLPRFPRFTLVERDDPRRNYFVQLARGGSPTLRQLAVETDIVARVTTSDGATLCVVTAGHAAR